jgi:hypothetical protein
MNFNELDFSQRVTIAFENPQYALDNVKVNLLPNFQKYQSGCLKKENELERDERGRWIKKNI